MNKLSILAILILLQSCDLGGDNYDKAKFQISNKSDSHIDSLIITNHQKDKINTKVVYDLDVHETKKINIDMTDVGGDGNYNIKYKINSKWYGKSFGYFTNGSQTEELISIQIIDTDSIIIDNKLKDKY